MGEKTMQELSKELNKTLCDFRKVFLRELFGTKLFKFIVKTILKLKGE